jgi:hypothetical protein
MFILLICGTGTDISPRSNLSKNACFISCSFSSVSSIVTSTFSFSSEINWREPGSGLDGAVSKIFVERRGLSYGIAGFPRMGVGGIGVSTVFEVEVFEIVAERGGEADIACAGLAKDWERV